MMRHPLLGAVAVAVLVHGGAAAQAPMEVMSDTLSYCTELEAQLAGIMAATPAPAEVKLLAEAGHQMCRDGEVRAGIARLRRALVRLHRPRENLPAEANGQPAR